MLQEYLKMQNDRYIAEIKYIRKKYSVAVFELCKSKDLVKQVESEKDELSEKCRKSEAIVLKLEEEKEFISNQLKEALEKIQIITSENEELRAVHKNETAKPKETTTKHCYGQRELAQLKMNNNILEARLTQAECGMRRTERFKRQEERNKRDDDHYEVEKILNHKLQKKKRFFLVRWAGFGPDADTWEPEANLECDKILQKYLKHNKI